MSNAIDTLAVFALPQAYAADCFNWVVKSFPKLQPSLELRHMTRKADGEACGVIVISGKNAESLRSLLRQWYACSEDDRTIDMAHIAAQINGASQE